MFKGSELFTIISNLFAAIEATNIKTGCVQEKVDTQKEGTL